MPVHLTAPDYGRMGDDPVLHQIRVNGHLGPILLTALPALDGVRAEVEALGPGLLVVRRVRPGRHQDPGFA
jgi:hypothetical protein